ncbi:MAG: VanZ family protein [Myxococcota bacterium]
MFPTDSVIAVTARVTECPGSIRRITVAWMWVAGWGGLIWILGSDSFSLADMKRTLLPWLDWLTGNLEDRIRNQIFFGIRKAAHFSVYAILALLAFRVTFIATTIATTRFQRAIAGGTALLIVATLASADEARQALSPARTGCPDDVLLDLAGGVVAVIIGLILSRRLDRERHTKFPSTRERSGNLI